MHAELEVITGPEAGRRFTIRPGVAVHVGRARELPVRIRDSEISRQHAELELDESGLYITDLDSRNGTFVNNLRLDPHTRTQLHDGHVLGLGQHTLTVNLQGLDPHSLEQSRRLLLLDGPLLSDEEFEVLGPLGQGASGRVWAARQLILDRHVALKVLREGLEERLRERFLREARVCARIHSPYVVALYDARVIQGRILLVMERVVGPSVRERLEAEGPLSLGEALRITLDIARGLDAAHQERVIHRDVKPHNVFLDPRGLAKLGDFGIAKDETVGSITETGIGLGSFAYMAPEQLTNAKTVDARADLYGLGATLYHMLAGRAPFVTSDPPDFVGLARQIVDSSPPTLDTFAPHVPHPVLDLVHRLLAKSPRERPTTADEVAEVLYGLVRRHPPSSQRLPMLDQSTEHDSP